MPVMAMATARTGSASPRAREILAAVDRTVARTLLDGEQPAPRHAAQAAPRNAARGAGPGQQVAAEPPPERPAVRDAEAMAPLVLGVAERTQQARATLDELTRALERLARHLAFDR